MFFCQWATSFKMKIRLDQYRTFIGFPIFHFEREIILKAGEDRIVPKYDILHKGIFFPTLAESLSMMARIWLLELLYHALAMAVV